ncbi:MAG TPA: hypothetical protein VF039_00350 [Longimicrobiales bacterium]
MRVGLIVFGAAALGLAMSACTAPRGLSDSGIRTTCGSLGHMVTGRHDPTVVLVLPASRSIEVDVTSRREGTLDGLDGRVERVKAKIGSAGAECSARSGSYRFEVRGNTDAVALELIGVGAAELVLEHDGRVLRTAFVDVSAEESIEVVL